MDVPLAACGLAPSVLAALLRAGFRHQKDLVDVSARELASEAKINVKDAVEAIEIARNEKNPSAVGDTALDLLQAGGGPGTGKTQFGIHACLAAQYVANTTDKPSSAIFIDSEGSFIIERVASMATHFLEDFRHIGADKLTRDDLLRGITYYRVHDFLEQMEILHSLPSYLQANAQCKLLVIDSVAFHFRHGFEDYGQRARALDELAAFLHGLATDFDLAVLLINHITTKSSSNDRQVSQERPALGESWTHSNANRVVFGWEANCRVARLIKSATLAHDSTTFEGTCKLILLVLLLIEAVPDVQFDTCLVSERGIRDMTDKEY
ncbi:DNA repair protein RAD51 [Phytophthora nicotianae]|uniref:DNA repair protein RAD51 homolog 3 n=1 Tax=Phytophthora nicotianae TaxID=4792 RepID=A0A0W8DVK6_PHYNI|nr:DNA repair protein RAD51 [Phytophthora nicotianae]